MKEYQIIVITPDRCTNCETCMNICSFVHDSKFIPLEKRIVGIRTRLEREWAIACDLCEHMRVELIEPDSEPQPQCVSACPLFAIFIGTIEAYDNETKSEAMKRIFNLKDR